MGRYLLLILSVKFINSFYNMLLGFQGCCGDTSLPAHVKRFQTGLGAELRKCEQAFHGAGRIQASRVLRGSDATSLATFSSECSCFLPWKGFLTPGTL